DFLGDHSLYFAGDVFSNSLQDANALLLYSVLPHRLDWSVGVFHFKNYFQSRVTTLGEELGSAKLFSERTFGALGGWSYPFNRFRRVELQFTQMFVEEQFFRELADGSFGPATRALGGVSEGRDPQVFRVGGFSTLRGFPDFDLLGTRLVLSSVELRFPFIEDLGVVGPLPIGNLRLRGAVFADMGTIWSGDTS